jgi:hypothetical protein
MEKDRASKALRMAETVHCCYQIPRDDLALARAEHLGRGNTSVAPGSGTNALRSLFNQLSIVCLQIRLNIPDAAHLRPHGSLSSLLHHLVRYQPLASVHDLQVGISSSPDLALNQFCLGRFRVFLHVKFKIKRPRLGRFKRERVNQERCCSFQSCAFGITPDRE